MTSRIIPCRAWGVTHRQYQSRRRGVMGYRVKCYTFLQQPTTALLAKSYRAVKSATTCGGGPLGLPSGDWGTGNTMGGGPFGLPSVPPPGVAIRVPGTETVLRNSATANQRGFIFTM